MKAKLYLTLLTLNGLILSANSAALATESNPNLRSNITRISQTIAKLIDVEDRTNLVELAIDRALLAQQVKQPELTHPVTAGVPRLDSTQMENKTPQTENKTTENDNQTNQPDNKLQPNISDRVVKPQLQIRKVGRYLKVKDSSNERAKTETDRQ